MREHWYADLRVKCTCLMPTEIEICAQIFHKQLSNFIKIYLTVLQLLPIAW
jgi:hypothetical protein